MTSAPYPSSSPASATEVAPVLRRRDILRRGAILAGAAGAAVVALKPDAASAGDGDNLVLGQGNASTATTSLTVGGDAGGAEPALALENADGPSLRMNALPITWAGQLAVGEMAGTDLGPIVGVDAPFGPTTTYLATGMDLANMATPFASMPTRILDLRTEAGRAAIIRRSSASALAGDGKLRSGQWIDIAVAFTGPDFSLEAVFANLAVVGPVRAGSAVLYQPGVLPPVATVHFSAGQTLANAAFVATGEVLHHHAIRLSTRRSDAWFMVEINGGVTRGTVQAPLGQTLQPEQTVRATGGRTALVSKLRQALGRMG
jgi:hypothetical protein